MRRGEGMRRDEEVTGGEWLVAGLRRRGGRRVIGEQLDCLVFTSNA